MDVIRNSIAAGAMTLIAAAAFAQDGAVIVKDDEVGGVYEGTFLNGLRHGTGSYRLPNGFEYSGEWIEGKI